MIDTTFHLVTDKSSMFTELHWSSDGETTGNLLVTFVNGGTYSYPRVGLSDMLAVLAAGEAGDSLGEALHMNVLCWNKAARRAA